MANEEKLLSCTQELCPVRDSGKCLEGLDLKDCTHFYLADPGEASNTAEQNVQTYDGPIMRLFSGKELPTVELGLVTNKFDTNLIIIIGESNSGKTTILTSIYDMFQTGKFKQYYFAGSMTQYGFESRCHLSRANSGLQEPDTEHTKAKEFNFLHIAYKEISKLSEPAYHLLLSDISGERFNMANNSAEMMNEMELVKKADHLIFLLDGDKLANKFERTAVITRAGQFITRALDTGIFDIQTKLRMIFTKADVLTPLVENGTLDKIENDFEQRFSARLKELTFGAIAARPKPPSAEFPFGTGLEDLLGEWKNRQPAFLPNIPTEDVTERFFNRYIKSNG